jgi:ribonuclease R
MPANNRPANNRTSGNRLTVNRPVKDRSAKDRPTPGLPTRKQILDFIQNATEPAGKREISRHFGLKGNEKIQLKALLKDMAEEGLIDGKRTAFHKMGGLPKVTVLRVIDIDEGEAIAVPDTWQPDDATPPPRIRLIEKGRGSALRKGDRVLSRTEESATGWRAFPMKKLELRADQILGVVEIDGGGKPWLAPVDKRIRNSSPISDLGEAKAGELVLGVPIGRSARPSVKVTEVLGEPLAPKSFSLIAIHKHGIPNHFIEEVLEEAQVSAKLPLSAEHREDHRRRLVLRPPRRPDRPRGAAARQLGLFPRPRRADAARSAQRRRVFAALGRGPRGDGLPHQDRRRGPRHRLALHPRAGAHPRGHRL